MPVNATDLTQGATLPGAITMPAGGISYTRIGAVKAVRVTGSFLVRGANSVDMIHDGWICQGEDGYLFGVEDASFAARLAIVTHTITASAGANGAIDPVGAQSVNDGANKVFTVTADALYQVDTVLVDGQAAVLTNGTYTFTNVTADHTIAVTFSLI